MAVRTRGSCHFVDYYDESGKRIRKSVGRNKRLAETVMKKVEVALAEGRYLDMKMDDRMIIDEAVADFLVYSKNNKRSYDDDVGLAERTLRFFGGKTIAEITPNLVEEYKAMRLATTKKNGKCIMPGTVNREIAFCKAAVNWAVKNGKVEGNAFNKVKLLKENNERVRYLDEDEMKRLVAACSPRLKPVVITDLNTGMRKEELLTLKRGQVNLKQRVILLTKTKSGKRRDIPINDQLMSVLGPLVPGDPEGNVFLDETGAPYNVDQLDYDFRIARRAAGIKNFRFHDLRHTAASWLAMSGVDPFTIKDILGHASLRMVERYVHLFPKHKKQAMEVLGNAIAPHIGIGAVAVGQEPAPSGAFSS